MADVPGQRILIQSEEVAYRSAVSEASMTRMAATTNFLNTRQLIWQPFNLNGPLDTLPTPQTNIDGAIPVFFDCEIVGGGFFLVEGSSGSGFFEVDIRRHTASGDAGTSIFFQTPRMTLPTTDNAYAVFAADGSTVGGGAGPIRNGIISTTNINAGDTLSVDLLHSGTGAENGSVGVFLRPR